MRIEKGLKKQAGSGFLEWIRIRLKTPRGMLFMPPLIGGDRIQQVALFRWLVRHNYELFSFSFSGHGHSSDKFSLTRTLVDTCSMLEYATELCENDRLDMYGIGCCYSVMPLLFSVHRSRQPLKGIVLINGICEINFRSIAASFFTYAQKTFPEHKRWEKLIIKLKNYVDFLFPDVTKDIRYFGILERKRTDLLQTLSDVLHFNPLRSICLSRVPVLCIYAVNDRILKMYGATGNDMTHDQYRQDIKRICPDVLFHPIDGDHFLSMIETRRHAKRSILEFLLSFNQLA